MDEDSGVKAAPVTRLRRRLSVEAEETKSPSAPATPTKKRPTRLAAKPQLELIDEHAVTSSPKRTTRKSISRDKVEPEEKPTTPARRNARAKSNTSIVSETEEKPLTPARRNTRTKSNTSIVSEAEEKPLTPARRNTRTKANTSLMLETAQSVEIETPRAKRAVARRNSQLESDSEAPLTPARTRRARKASTSSTDKDETPSVSESAITPGRTRRSRKGSTSSIDAPAEAALAEKPSLITQVIVEVEVVEEPENKHRKSTSDKNGVDNKDDSPSRKSPRLMAKKNRKSNDEDTNETQNQQNGQGEQNDNIPTSTTEPTRQNAEDIFESDISVSSAKLITDLDRFDQFQNKILHKNKSMSDVEDTLESKKRNRTKSWTTLCASSPPIEGNFYSDNEDKKKKLKKNAKIFKEKPKRYGDDTGSGDGVNQIIAAQEEEEKLSCDVSKKNRKSRNSSISHKLEKSDEGLSSNTLNKSQKSRNNSISNKSENHESKATRDVDTSNESNKENLDLAPVSKNTSGAEHLFEDAPSADVKSMVFLEDSDSNSCSMMKEPEDDQASTIFALNYMNEVKSNNDSVEPMDIDETMPENVSLTAFGDDSKRACESSLRVPQEVDSVSQDTLNKSKRKSSLSHFQSQSVHDSLDDDMQNKKSHELSASVTPKSNNDSVNTATNHKQKSLSQSISDGIAINENKENSAESLYDTTDEVMLKKKSRKSSLVAAQESSTSLIDNHNKSKTKSRSNSEDNPVNGIQSTCNKSSEEIATDENLRDNISPKSSISTAHDSDNSYKEINKSKRKGSLSHSITYDKTGNEDKSTLKLSQIKDMSTAENSVSESPEKNNYLSKSVSIEKSSKDGPVNKNLTLTYLTSTPVQQKSFDKLAMQMNTSVITPTNTSTKDLKMSKNKSTPIASKSSSDEASESSDKVDSSQDKSNLFDDKAEDAGESYESGDSQDEAERLYEKENEIIDNGETLTSEEEVSNDSDYEKDSFIVSSNEEDDELLSGSGDDLSLSDNELTLSSKSKKKYNERKLKEQKKASREMYEARHGLKPAKNCKSKNSRSRLDSTLLKSDEDTLPPKKNKRMRLESETDDTNKNHDNNIESDNAGIGYIKKKSKRLSESVYNESVMNEQEISIYNEHKIQNNDPLSVQIKTEPKTPQKDLEISRVHVTDDVEHVHIDENKSMMKLNDTNDPLQTTRIQEEIESDDDSISENEEITKNYELVLKELNNDSKKNIQSHDISLNVTKKDKQKRKNTIIDELNITETRISKKDNSLLAKEKSVKRVFKKLSDDTDDSSDAINIQLLFSDDSNGADKNNDSNKNNFEGLDAKVSFISLKKTDAKTNIHQSTDGLNFFIDTKGDLEDNAASNDAAVNESDSDDAPVEVLYMSEKKKNNHSLTKTPNKEKKNKKLESEESDLQENTPASKKNKKTGEKKKKISLSHETAAAPQSVLKTPVSEKKKEKKSSESLEVNAKSSSGQEEIADTNEDSVNHPKKRKRKQSANKAADDIESAGAAVKESDSDDAPVEVFNISRKKKTPSSEKKDKKLESAESDLEGPNILVENTPSSKKNKKIGSHNIENEIPISEKKKKLSLSHETAAAQESVSKSPISEKKKEKKLSESLEINAKSSSGQEEIADTMKDSVNHPKKRKRKQSTNNTADDIEFEGKAQLLNSSHQLDGAVVSNKKKKKLKISTSVDDNEIQANIATSTGVKKSENDQTVLTSNSNIYQQDVKISGKERKLTKKRKERDEDKDGNVSKVFKENVFDKVHVPRLPSTIIEQLGDWPTEGPHKKTKTKAVSTSNFIVEEAKKRKNKPSVFMEESVYLNDETDTTLKKKRNANKPKLLPFLPTVSTSDKGFTTNFHVNVISQKMEFVAQRDEVPNFKNDYLNNRRIKKLRTYDLYKKKRNMKLSKY